MQSVPLLVTGALVVVAVLALAVAYRGHRTSQSDLDQALFGRPRRPPASSTTTTL